MELSFFVGFCTMILFLEGTCKACKLEGEFKMLLKLVISTTNFLELLRSYVCPREF